jgi:hypothetical protein
LHRCDNDFRPPPVVTVLLVDQRLKVGREQFCESLPSLILQFEAIHEKQDAPSIAGTQEDLDDGGSCQRFAGAGGHLKKEAVFAFLDRPLQSVDSLKLIGTQKAKFVGLDVAGTLFFASPRGFRLIGRALGENDVVVADLLLDETLRVG